VFETVQWRTLARCGGWSLVLFGFASLWSPVIVWSAPFIPWFDLVCPSYLVLGMLILRRQRWAAAVGAGVSICYLIPGLLIGAVVAISLLLQVAEFSRPWFGWAQPLRLLLEGSQPREGTPLLLLEGANVHVTFFAGLALVWHSVTFLMLDAYLLRTGQPVDRAAIERVDLPVGHRPPPRSPSPGPARGGAGFRPPIAPASPPSASS
jgi:hypothetical protein